MADPVIDWEDPCQRAAALRSAYFALLSGAQEQRIRFRNADTEEEVWFAPAKLEVLATELKSAEAACMAKMTGRPARRAIIAG